MAYTQQPQTIVERISYALKQDQKKVLVLAVLVIVLGGMWAKMALSGGSTAPKSAAAMTTATTAPETTPATTGTSATDGRKGRARSADGATLLREWLEAPLPQEISRNLFELRIDYFPMDGSRPSMTNSRTEEKDPTFWDQLAKSIDAQADQQHKREILIANLRQQAAKLELSSTVMGPRPKAMIDGAMVGEGDSVAQFRVLKIESRGVIVEREGIKLAIPMK